MTEWCYNYDDILSHHGILGQKWGVRRYQNKDGTLTPAGRKRYKIDEEGNIVAKTRQERKEEAKQAKKDSAEAKRLRRLELEHETQEKKKERLIKERNISEIYKNRDMFTTQELSEIYNRFNMERNISNLIPKEKEKTYSDTVDKLAKNINSTTNLIDSGTRMYNMFAKINNSVSDNKLPVIGTEKQKKKTEADIALERLKAENERLKAQREHEELTRTDADRALDRLKAENERMKAQKEHDNLEKYMRDRQRRNN